MDLVLNKTIISKDLPQKGSCSLWCSCAGRILHIDIVNTEFITAKHNFLKWLYCRNVMDLILRVARIPFKVIHQRPSKVSLYVGTIKYRSCSLKVKYLFNYVLCLSLTFQELIDVVFVKVFSVHVVQVSNSVRVAIFRNVNRNCFSILFRYPAHHFSNSERSHI